MQSRRSYLCIVCRTTCLCARQQNKHTQTALLLVASMRARQHPRCLLKTQCTSRHGGACNSSRFSCAPAGLDYRIYILIALFLLLLAAATLISCRCVRVVYVYAKAAFVRVFCIYLARSRALTNGLFVYQTHTPSAFDEPHRRHACANVSEHCTDIARGQNLILLLVLIESV